MLISERDKFVPLNLSTCRYNMNMPDQRNDSQEFFTRIKRTHQPNVS
jgi:hypothetical protein